MFMPVVGNAWCGCVLPAVGLLVLDGEGHSGVKFMPKLALLGYVILPMWLPCTWSLPYRLGSFRRNLAYVGICLRAWCPCALMALRLTVARLDLLSIVL